MRANFCYEKFSPYFKGSSDWAEFYEMTVNPHTHYVITTCHLYFDLL